MKAEIEKFLIDEGYEINFDAIGDLLEKYAQSKLESARKENEISYWNGYNDGFGSSQNIAPDMLDDLTKN